MFKHYLATALRHFARHKTTTIINVLCLALGLASFAVSYGFVSYFKHADRHHSKADRTYVVTQRYQIDPAARWTFGPSPNSGWSIGPLIDADHPELEAVVRASLSQDLAVATPETKDYAQVSFADPEFLDLFDLPFVVGDARNALRAPHSAVVSQEFAKKFFGDANPLGRALILNNRETVRITGVIAPPKQPSHISTRNALPILRFAVLASMDSIGGQATTANVDATRNRLLVPSVFTYVLFTKESSLTPDELRADLVRFSERHVPKDFGQVTLGLRPASEIYVLLGDAVTNREKTGLSNITMTYVYGLLVLIAACINYANLASAQATTRLKELAMRRVVGASRWQVFAQSFLEALLLLAIAGALALALLPGMAQAMTLQLGLDIGSQLFGAPRFWLWFFVTILVVALVACSYPTWVASKILPAHALQSGRAPTTKRRLIHAFVVIQFAAASMLFVVSVVVHTQNQRSLPDRMSSDDPIVVIGNDLRDAGVDVDTLTSELLRDSSVRTVGRANVAPIQLTQQSRATMLAGPETSSKRWTNMAPLVDEQFFAAMNIKLLAGRLLSRETAGDVGLDHVSGNAVIDRALASEYGWRSPEEAIGKTVYVASSAAKDAVARPRTVVGVVENKVMVPLSLMGSTSTLYTLNPDRAVVPIVRVAQDNVANSIRAIDATWNRLAPNIPLKRRFLDEQFEAAYRQFTSIMNLFPVLAIFATLIGALGLTGIATHAMAQRKFEIGVRRTLGASAQRVLIMLLKDFGKPILIANLIAWPFAFGYAKLYTSFFSDKAPVTFTPFALSLLVGLAIAWLAVLRQATSAARMNPATVLRHE